MPSLPTFECVELNIEGNSVASITIRNLEDDLKQRIRVRAAEHGHSLEEEVREILRHAVVEPQPPKNLGKAIHARFAKLGGVDLHLPERGPKPTGPPALFAFR
jgi:antitoxin FitA